MLPTRSGNYRGNNINIRVTKPRELGGGKIHEQRQEKKREKTRADAVRRLKPLTHASKRRSEKNYSEQR